MSEPLDLNIYFFSPKKVLKTGLPVKQSRLLLSSEITLLRGFIGSLFRTWLTLLDKVIYGKVKVLFILKMEKASSVALCFDRKLLTFHFKKFFNDVFKVTGCKKQTLALFLFQGVV